MTKVRTNTETVNALQAELQAALAENARLKAAQRSKLRLAASDKGCVSLYGVRRFPLSFYIEEWEKVFAMTEEIRTFIEDNRDELVARSEAAREARQNGADIPQAQA